MKAWLVYTLARLGIFAAALAVLLVIGLQWYWAAIGAALIGLLVSYIALPGLRGRVTSNIAARRGRPERDADSDFEDDFVDAADTDAADTDAPVADRPVSDADRHRERREHDAE
ncbi:DUF4229 domain-containing protein [Curtobacterium sp. NPDC087080]|uniref:DUF4229 domain-containing protein n=1 Tax=Curtobacterium sp. NPDC087080 TaxID=3363965 RepID=UPI0037FE058E